MSEYVLEPCGAGADEDCSRDPLVSHQRGGQLVEDLAPVRGVVELRLVYSEDHKELNLPAPSAFHKPMLMSSP